jgi:CheY-like chemotaxis protein
LKLKGTVSEENIMSELRAEERDENIRWELTPDEEPGADGPTILFVEDEAFVREVTAEVLRSAGYEVLTAKNTMEALRLYEQGRTEVSLLLTDVVLPGETGRVLAGQLRQKNPELKVLFVTGYAEHMQLGQDDECLAKPFSMGVLLRRVRQMLDGDRVWIAKEEAVRLACGNA